MRQRIVLALLALCLSVPMVVAGGAQKPKAKPAQPPAAAPKDQNKTNPPAQQKSAPQATKKAPVADNQSALLVGVSLYTG
jgi:hypothetical protein